MSGSIARCLMVSDDLPPKSCRLIGLQGLLCEDGKAVGNCASSRLQQTNVEFDSWRLRYRAHQESGMTTGVHCKVVVRDRVGTLDGVTFEQHRHPQRVETR